LEKERLEKERKQRERRQIQIAYLGLCGGTRTWNVSIDGTTTEEDIRPMAEGLSKKDELILVEDRTNRELGR
jgi:hypothetical protein